MNKLFLSAILLAAAGGLGGCATYDRGYGYGGVEVGAGYGGYYPGYAGYAYGADFYPGWYDGFYYPGNGYFVYDRAGYRHRWSDSDRARWRSNHPEWANRGTAQGHGNWQGRGTWQGHRSGTGFRSGGMTSGQSWHGSTGTTRSPHWHHRGH